VAGDAGRCAVSSGRREYTEEDVRIRPGKGSRPRTRNRPAHADAVPGVVVAVDRGRYTCLLGEPGRTSDDAVEVVAKKARQLGRTGVVVGDRVGLVGDISGEVDAIARLIRVEPRRSVLRRTADDDDPVERVIVANAEQLAVVTAVANPEPRPRLIDRCLVAAFDAGLEPLLIVTKVDLQPPDVLLELYQPLGVAMVVATRGGDLAAVRTALAGRVTVLVGHSGVGKSTLVNALVPTALRTTGVVNAVTGRGRHTSSSAVALRLPFGGWVVDTPGLRSFGLAHVTPGDVLRGFGDLAAAAQDCPRGCTHLADSPDCALDDAITAGVVEPARLDSFRRLLGSRLAPSDA